jgi:hypothetical protein
MPTNIKCPMCKRALEVPDELMGKRVKCPGCKMIFTATPPGAAPPEDSSARRPRAGQKSEEAVRRKRPAPPPDEDEDEEDEEEGEQPRVRKKPSRRREEDYEDEQEEYEDEDEEDEEEVRPRRRGRFRRDAAPHRGGTILTLGILSLVCLPIVFGPLAWTMGNNDLKQMRAGRMDRSGEGMTRAGKICGIIATVLMIVSCVGWAIMFGLSAALNKQ